MTDTLIDVFSFARLGRHLEARTAVARLQRLAAALAEAHAAGAHTAGASAGATKAPGPAVEPASAPGTDTTTDDAAAVTWRVDGRIDEDGQGNDSQSAQGHQFVHPIIQQEREGAEQCTERPVSQDDGPLAEAHIGQTKVQVIPPALPGRGVWRAALSWTGGGESHSRGLKEETASSCLKAFRSSCESFRGTLI